MIGIFSTIALGVAINLASNRVEDLKNKIHIFHCSKKTIKEIEEAFNDSFNSWYRTVEYGDEIPAGTQQSLYRDIQRQIFRSGVINVCARANNGNTNIYFPHYAEREDWILNVGGNDKNGFKHPNSSYGAGVDFIAPYDNDIIYSINNYTTDTYQSFSGTSAAAPHASGVVALMLSHIDNRPDTPNNLAPDDVEFLIQRYAKDVIPDLTNLGYQVGYDDLSGWGRLDAGAVLEKIDRTQYIIKHVKAEIPIPMDLSGATQASGQINFADNNLPWGGYTGTIYHVPFNLQNNLLAGDVILNYWPLNSYTTLIDTEIGSFPSFPLRSENGCFITGMNNTSGDVSGSVVHLTQDPNGNPIDYWYPSAPGELVRVGYTLHIQSDHAGLEENEEGILKISCFPNPTSNNITVNFVLTESADVNIEVVDIKGREIYKTDLSNFTMGEQSIVIRSEEWNDGMYFVNLKANEKSKVVKFIKQ